MPEGRNPEYWERRRQKAKERYAKKKDNPEEKARRNAYHKKWYAENKERRAEVGRAWRDNNPDKAYEIAKRARARRRGVSDETPPGFWAAVVKYCDGKCLACGNSPVTQDHIVALVNGGRHHPDNLQPLCGSCNDSKGIKETDYRPSDWPFSDVACAPRSGVIRSVHVVTPGIAQ